MSAVKNDAYSWHVRYRDGTELPEFDGLDTEGRGFAEVEDMRVGQLALVHAHFPAFVVNVSDGDTPVFFRRRSREMTLEGVEIGSQTVHCIGWKHGDLAVYLFVFDDGSCLLADDLQAV